jgi:hypothetical protein
MCAKRQTVFALLEDFLKMSRSLRYLAHGASCPGCLCALDRALWAAFRAWSSSAFHQEKIDFLGMYGLIGATALSAVSMVEWRNSVDLSNLLCCP